MRYAVGYINFFDNDLKIEIVEASSVREAVNKHSCIVDYGVFPEDLEDIKNFFFNADAAIDVVQIDGAYDTP